MSRHCGAKSMFAVTSTSPRPSPPCCAITNDSWTLGPPDGGFGWGNNNLGPIGQAWSQPGRVVIGKLSKTIGQTAVNDFTFSYSANRITITPADGDPGLRQQLNDTIPTFFPLSGKTYRRQGPVSLDQLLRLAQRLDHRSVAKPAGSLHLAG